MRNARRIVVFVVWILCAVVALPQSSQWKEYVYAEDGFAIASTEPPSVSKRTLKAVAGEVEAHLYLIEVKDAHLIIMLAPFHPDDQRTPEQALEAAKKGITLSGAKLISQKQITLGKYPGLENETENDEYRQRFRFYVANRRLYTLAVAVSKGKPYPEELKRWDSSFRILEAKN